jgi:hypothetical protein
MFFKLIRRFVVFLALTVPLGHVTQCRPAAAAERPLVSIVTDAAVGTAATYGFDKILAALRAKNIACEKADSLDSTRGKFILVTGLANGEGPAARLLKAGNYALPQVPEALIVRHAQWQGKPAWIVGGADDRGLMYAELDVADRIGWVNDNASPLSEVRDALERPAVRDRAVSIYTMNRAYWESRFYDEAYWARYLDMLAQNRFNSLVVIFGYENGGFLAPPYPYFFDVEGFADVRMVGITRKQQQDNLRALNRLIRMAHDRGLSLTVGIWDHIYRGGVQGGGVPGANEAVQRPTAGLVWGVTGRNLVPYTKAALAKFVQQVPALDGIQFRMHDESGLKNSEQAGFWRDVFAMMQEKAPHLRLDLRAKGLPDAVIETALGMDVNFRITTKYWMEQMCLPFHPTHVNLQDQHNRRHSYADLLRYPQRYKVVWRLWNGGTARVLLWGDPEYARRFVESTHLYDGDGFEVNEPLATKMEGQPHDAKSFELLKPPYRYYDYEFERYWHFFQAFGRIGYNPATPADVWQREFERRFGKPAAPFVEKGLHRASWVLPRIVAACYPYSYFPMTRGWAEKQRLGDLPAYAKAEGSDVQQFASFDEEAKNQLAGTETAKTRPLETSRWLSEAAAEILENAATAEKLVAGHRNKEFDSTIVDLKILANLSLFHARRIPAAVSYCRYVRSGEVRDLDEAIAHEGHAIEAWQSLVRAAGDVYADDLMMGARSASLCGHWRDELSSLEKGLAALKRRRSALPGIASARPRAAMIPPAVGEPPVVIHSAVVSARAGKPLTITAEVRAPSGVKWVNVRYRAVSQYDDFKSRPMLPTGQKNQYQVVIPGEDIVPQWDLMYLIEVMDNQGRGRIYPDLNKETPYIVVRLAR